MKNECYDIHQTPVQMIMAVHLQEIRREGPAGISYADLEDYLADYLWKRRKPRTLNEAAGDILKVTSDDIVRFLARQAVTDGASGNLADFTDILGGTK
ncbi:MAG: post-transcriptional regulator [Solobacterium sp.]|nr:post-transcriptional regulator [Solobacterium sp.]MCH4048131.1 post-transcriptional regulator [Solobacterium sp.]MCH4075015.1 post-transcriptional regulator [Solobacterium sp.]MCI1314227.1 post-transcriptional regulator [Solobacterium sp.]MCI1346497.1 post-transcriptional regulator [Solobacterium sp.]